MDEAIGCQPVEPASDDAQNVENSSENLVSRLGIEPRTRRLRERESTVRVLSSSRFL